MENNYAGESIAKKVCRVRLYRLVRKALKWPRIEPKSMLCLCGPEAAEAGAIRHIFKGSDVVGVDRDPDACAAFKRKLPGSTVIEGNLGSPELLEALRGKKFDFVHLDLMGTVSGSLVGDVVSCLPYIRTLGVLAVTYLRGRERKGWSGLLDESEDLLSGAYLKRGLIERKRTLSQDARRAASLQLQLIGHALDPNKLDRNTLYPEMIGNHVYQANVSPMGVAIFQIVSPSFVRDQAFSAFMRKTGCKDWNSKIPKDPMNTLLLEAESLSKEFDPEQVAEILNVSRGTLAAWKSHRTMGTYQEAA